MNAATAALVVQVNLIGDEHARGAIMQRRSLSVAICIGARRRDFKWRWILILSTVFNRRHGERATYLSNSVYRVTVR